jgi:hypothetical protein
MNNMLVEQIYTQCLAQGAYYIESECEAAVIDPLWGFLPYVELARNGMLPCPINQCLIGLH